MLFAPVACGEAADAHPLLLSWKPWTFLAEYELWAGNLGREVNWRWVNEIPNAWTLCDLQRNVRPFLSHWFCEDAVLRSHIPRKWREKPYGHCRVTGQLFFYVLLTNLFPSPFDAQAESTPKSGLRFSAGSPPRPSCAMGGLGDNLFPITPTWFYSLRHLITSVWISTLIPKCVNPNLGVSSILAPTTAISVLLAGGQKKCGHGAPVWHCSAASRLTNCTLLTSVLESSPGSLTAVHSPSLRLL